MLTNKKFLIKIALIVIAVSLFFGAIAFYSRSQEKKGEKYTNFLLEVYDKIQQNYWEKISNEELSELFRLGTEKLTSKQQDIIPKNKTEIKTMLLAALKNINGDKKEKFSADLANIVLANLQPFGRSGLYSQVEEKNLKNRVENVNPQTGKTESTIVSGKTNVNPQTGQAESTIISEPTGEKIISPEISYIKITSFSPATFDDFQKASFEADAKGDKKLNALILDLRGNVGGSIDILPYFLGPFIGPDQYAYEFYHQGEKIPYKTLMGWLPSLVRYKKVIILIDENSQSTAELFAAVLKKYNVGILVGTPTRGWGTIEKVFQINNQISSENKYSVFLVHSLSLRDDNQPIEGRGVEPLVNVNDKDWQAQLFAYFSDNQLIEAVKTILSK